MPQVGGDAEKPKKRVVYESKPKKKKPSTVTEPEDKEIGTYFIYIFYKHCL